MKTYRIIEAASGKAIVEKNLRGDGAAKNWLRKLTELGVISAVPVKLQRRTMSDSDADKLPMFSNGEKQSAWATI